MRDCIFLVADSNMAACIQGFLNRDQFHRSLGVEAFVFDPNEDLIVDEGGYDPGVYHRAHELLRPFLNSHRFALIILDREWEGSPGAEKIVDGIRTNMLHNGWSDGRFAVIVIDPELEAWIWQDSPHVETAFRFKGPGRLRDLLKEDGTWPEDESKPLKPKEAVETVLRRTRTPRSSAVYRRITEKVSVDSCTDPSFTRLVEALRRWFPKGD